MQFEEHKYRQEITPGEYFGDLFFRPKTFFSKYYDGEKPPYFLWQIITYTIGFGVSPGLLASYFLPMFLMQYPLAVPGTWLHRFTHVAIFALLFGYFRYLLGVWLFRLRLQWSGAEDNKEKAEFIYLNSAFIHHAAIIAVMLITAFFSSTPADRNAIYITELAGPLVLYFFEYYSIYAAWRGAMTLTAAEKPKSIFWFIIVPVLISLAIPGFSPFAILMM